MDCLGRWRKKTKTEKLKRKEKLGARSNVYISGHHWEADQIRSDQNKSTSAFGKTHCLHWPANIVENCVVRNSNKNNKRQL